MDIIRTEHGTVTVDEKVATLTTTSGVTVTCRRGASGKWQRRQIDAAFREGEVSLREVKALEQMFGVLVKSTPERVGGRVRDEEFFLLVAACKTMHREIATLLAAARDRGDVAMEAQIVGIRDAFFNLSDQVIAAKKAAAK